ncbi:GOLGA5 [Bugula neritina]|uniref:GOLGA5 n=1 Tax=Bugula neritina TaxID=10212 RepID=A0A7J7JBS5_BUGNE|nr:GOLGA5 [Bugula neritina]
MKECGVEGVDGELSSDINAEMEQEKIMLRQELQQSSALVESLRMEVQDLETQLQADHDESRQTIDNLEDKLSQTQSRYSGLEQELRQKDEEMKYTQEQSVLQKTTLQQQITDRDVEIDKLRNQVMSKKLSTASESELETRLHQLTENLIEKQTTTVFVGEEDGMRHRPNLPSFLKESPTDPEFARKVKRAANTIDRFSIRLGVFLRRYPIARVFVIIYMLLLHLWTMIVLLTYQPEMHGSEHSHMPVPLDHVPKDLPT